MASAISTKLPSILLSLFGIFLAIFLLSSMHLAPSMALSPGGAIFPANIHAQLSKPRPPIAKTRESMAVNVHPLPNWVTVPAWLAGTWHTSNEIILSSYNYAHKNYETGLPKQIRINRTSKIGAQRDKLGAIWHLASPNHRTIDAGDFIEYQHIEAVNVISSTASAVVVKSKATVSRISKEGDLLDRFREETLTTYTRLNDGELITDFVITDFDMNGSPTHSSRAICTEKRIRPFEVLDEDARGPLKVLFHEFLLDHGQLNLIPNSR